MRKKLAMLLALVLLITLAGAVPALAEEGSDETLPLPPMIKDGASVVSVYAGAEAFPLEASENAPGEGDAPTIALDAILVYLSDNTFDQYAQTPGGFELFASGTYALKDDIIEITLNKKYSMDDKKLEDFLETEEFDLNAIRDHQIFGSQDGREVEAIFADDCAVSYVNDEGVVSKLDVIWLYFSDGTFAEYAFLDGNVVPFGNGTYTLSETGDFHILPAEEDYGTITMTWEDSLGNLAGKTETFNLGTMGAVCLYEKQDDALLASLAF